MKEYQSKIQHIPQEKIVYVDESGMDSFLYRKYARAERGVKVFGKIFGRKFERTNIVAAQNMKRIIAPLQYKGMMHSLFFEECFEKHLIPVLPKNAVIIMDNASFHRKKRLYRQNT